MCEGLTFASNVRGPAVHPAAGPSVELVLLGAAVGAGTLAETLVPDAAGDVVHPRTDHGDLPTGGTARDGRSRRVSALLRAWTAQRVVLRDQARPRPRLVRTVRRWTNQRRTDITAITQQDTNANSLSRPPYIFR